MFFSQNKTTLAKWKVRVESGELNKDLRKIVSKFYIEWINISNKLGQIVKLYEFSS